LEKRHFTIRVVDNPDNCQSERELKWKGVRKIDIHLDEEDLDDNCMDSIIGIHEDPTGNQYNIYIQTDKYGIEFSCENSVLINDTT
jgi:hypothetical protein